jgi:signal transduction histidine kinase
LKAQNEELDRRRREAEEVSNRKTRFLASVSHDIRTPINTISLMAEVLCLARFDAVEVELHLSEFSLSDLLADECAHARPVAEATNLWLKVEAPEDPIRLRSDRLKLVCIVGNLLGNAIKFTHAGGVTVTTALEPKDSP